MDSRQFDLFARGVARTGSRRSVLGVLLSVALLGPERAALAQKASPGKNKRGPKACHIKKCPENEPCPDCPTNPNIDAPKAGTCCEGEFCSCGGVCCTGCGIQTLLAPGGETPIGEREVCCDFCEQTGDRCCAGCTEDGECVDPTPYGGGSIRRR